MTVLLVIGGVWLGLLVLVLVLGAVHAANCLPTPRPVSPRPAFDGNNEAARRAARVPSVAV